MRLWAWIFTQASHYYKPGAEGVVEASVDIVVFIPAATGVGGPFVLS